LGVAVLSLNLSFNIWASVLATFPNIGQICAQFSGHSAFKTGLSARKYLLVKAEKDFPQKILIFYLNVLD
jgi:hypothetical protein